VFVEIVSEIPFFVDVAATAVAAFARARLREWDKPFVEFEGIAMSSWTRALDQQRT